MSATAVATGRETRPQVKERGDWRRRYFDWFCVSVLLVFAAIWAIPTLFALDTSLKPEGEITLNPTTWWTNNWTVDAYTKVVGAGDIGHWYLNSFVVALVTAVLTVVICSMIGFALALTRFVGRGAVFGFVAAGLLIPGQVLIIPMFQEFNLMRLLNTYWALILPAIAAPIAVFIFVAFFNGIPSSLAESAHVDGASWGRIYRSIYLPLSRPAISAVFIFTFVWSWNSFLWPLLVMTNPRMMTIPVGLSQVSSAFGIHYAQIMASAILGALPLLVVFLIFQRQIVEGVATTGLK